jgi:hypothetical protein
MILEGPFEDIKLVCRESLKIKARLTEIQKDID